MNWTDHGNSPMTTLAWLVLAAAVVIVALALYSAGLWWQVWRRSRALRERESQRNARLAGDIQILARGLLAHQVPMVEGAIRIKVLLDNYTGSRRTDLQVQVFEAIYESTIHIPTHQAWKDLSRAERELHRRHMDRIERDHKATLEQAARQLADGIAAPGTAK